MAERYRKPQTIDELKQFCAEKGMPLEKMRFFIGEDYPHPRAFGIYEDADGDFVVYKNKADGTRAVRYKGPNEAYAVNELYEKLKYETDKRRGNATKRNGGNSRKTTSGILRLLVPYALFAALAAVMAGPEAFPVILIPLLIFPAFAAEIIFVTRRVRPATLVKVFVALFAALVIYALVFGTPAPRRGYYRYDDRPYYYYRGDWYGYNNYGDWYEIDNVDPYLEENYSDYYVSKDYDSGYGVSDFEDSDYWTGYADSYYDSDDDYDWDSGSDWDSWDSSDTDWDSDW